MITHDVYRDTTTHANEDRTPVWGNAHAEYSETSFSSAVRRNETTPSKRRRGSDGLARRGRTDHDPWVDETSSGSHSRSRTVDDEAGTGSHCLSNRSTSQHPLRKSSSKASTSSWTLDHETRPIMQRMLSDEMAPRRDDGGTNDTARVERQEGKVQDRETLVIVHEVQPKDSLAGVALKYGISLPELRRANQMWTSDTIHLRKVLYIPVDKTRQARQLREALIETFMPSDTNPSQSSDAASSSTQQHDSTRTADTDLPDIGKLTLRRVPASQLSFFPPPTHSSSILDDNTPASLQPPSTIPNGRSSRARAALPASFTRATESPLQGVLDVFSSSLQTTANHVRASTTSLFGGSPVRAPTTFASRLSLESNSGTPSSPSEDLDWEHELEDVTATWDQVARRKKSTIHAQGQARNHGTDPAQHKRAHARQASASLNASASSPPAVREREERESVELATVNASEPRSPTRTHRRDGSGRSPPGTGGSRGRGRSIVPYAGTDGDEDSAGGVAEWGSPKARRASVVRTAQMEPSPTMQLPLVSKRRTVSGDS